MERYNRDNFCVILAGGKGRRLWPVSRENCPKQFLDFFSTGRTLLQQTYDRLVKFIVPENIFVSTNQEYEHLVREQLPELPHFNVLSEPIHRNTAPSVAWATFRVLRTNKKARLVVVPSDQAVFNEEAFIDNLQTALDFVGNNDSLLTIGVKPTRPEPGYGYIQKGEPVGEGNLYKVKSFTEKPDRDFARMFMENGEFYWNTGLFLANVRYLRECLKSIFPPVLRIIDIEGQEVTIEEELKYVKEKFPLYPNLSIDYGILDKNDNVYVMECGFGWADLGTWHSMYESLSRGEGDNVVVASQVIMENSHNNIIKLPADHMGIIHGLDGYIVAEKGNVLMICKKEDSSALIRKYINEVQLKYGDEFI
ncbi:MAG: mannose-1-phosphate guanylyltransferase [Prevotella sp.]|nr:mannose-1-phosphate guanylyltransferase [Prevotella sp.]MBQ8629583.1 mannose-1-phosphate guanylyltransferase [Prevotella sp.]